MQPLAFYPFAYAIRKENLNNYCWYCLKHREGRHFCRIQRCSACKTALFCGQLCQRLGWKDHKVECHGLKENRPFIPEWEARLLGRVVVRHMQITNGEHLLSADFFLSRNSRRSLMDLCDRGEEMRRDEDYMSVFEEIYSDLCLLYKKKYLLPRDEIFKIWSIISAHAQTIHDGRHDTIIAKALYLDLSAYSHSCRPNATIRHDGLVIRLHPLVKSINLADTESTFISYIDLKASKEQRQKMLKDTWHLDCKCVRCLDERDHLLTAVRCAKCAHSVTIYDSNDRLKKDPLVCGNCRRKLTISVDAAVEDMERIDRMLEELESDSPEITKPDLELIAKFEQKLAKENVYLTRLYDAALNLMDELPFAKRLDYLLKSVPCMRMCYPPNDPALAYHYVDIASMQKQLRDRKSAMKTMSKAVKASAVFASTDPDTYEEFKCYMQGVKARLLPN